MTQENYENDILSQPADSVQSTAEPQPGRFQSARALLSSKAFRKWALIALAAFLVIAAVFLVVQSGVLENLFLADDEVRMPDIQNQPLDVVQDTLAELGLQLLVVGAEYSPTLPPNMITSQSIPKGEIVKKGSTVEVYISTDWDVHIPADQTMPNVLFRLEAEAVATLESLNLVVDVHYVYNTYVAEGLVTRQSPDAGQSILDGMEVTLLVSRGKDPNQAQDQADKVTLSRDRYDLYVGNSVTLQASGGTGSYTYSSSDPSVVTVDGEGRITAVGSGNAIITVTSPNAEQATCAVFVQDYTLTVQPGSLTLYKGGSVALTVSGIPGNAAVTWSSDNTGAATVDKNGTVTGIGPGAATVTASWKYNGKTYTGHCAVTVQEGGITLDTYSIAAFYVGQTRVITAATAPANLSVTWSSSDEAVAKVASDGTVTAVGPGVATITAKAGEYTQTCSVTVSQPSLGLSKTELSMYPADVVALTASVNPSGIAVQWGSDDAHIATVSDGKVRAVAAGTTFIWAKMEFAGKTYEVRCQVTVRQCGVTLSETSLQLMPGDSTTLRVTTSPAEQPITWSSSNPSVVSISGGQVQALAIGTATVTASMTVDGTEYTASCAVTVSGPTISISAGSTNIEFSQRDNRTVSLSAKITPDGGTITWSSSDPTVATIVGNGISAVVTAQNSGTTVIRAVYKINGVEVEDSCELTFQKAKSTLAVSDLSYPPSGTFDSFTMTGTVTSNYALERIECRGVAAAAGIDFTIKRKAEDYVFAEDVYEFDASIAATYFLGQFRALYNTFLNLSGFLGIDQTVELTVYCTGYDSSGASISFTFQYTVNG